MYNILSPLVAAKNDPRGQSLNYLGKRLDKTVTGIVFKRLSYNIFITE